MEVIKIPANKELIKHDTTETAPKRRVVAYARVSTDSDEQLTSYEAQVDYYQKYIQHHENWEYVKIFTDEGISGCTIKYRKGFQSMVDEALNGSFDLIITKSVSRFARNTVDSLTTIRTLKEHGVEIYFEKENIWSFDPKCELLLSIISSIAQEESRNISENVTWAHRKRMADGKIQLPYGAFLGYKKGADGKPEIVPGEAKIVKLIYSSFISGMTPHKIKVMLMENCIPSPTGNYKWHTTTILSILTNEKYKGSALLQKTFTVDFLNKKRKKNDGEVPQYYINNSHSAIISPEEFDFVQTEIIRRKRLGILYSSNHIFSSKIKCGCCGGLYGSKVWHSISKRRKTVWQCNNKYKIDCHISPTVDDLLLKEMFIKAYNTVCIPADNFLSSCKQTLDTIDNESDIETTLSTLHDELHNLDIIAKSSIKDEAQHPQDKDFYERKIAEYEVKRSELKAKIDEYETQKESTLIKKEFLKRIIREFLSSNDALTKFSEYQCQLALKEITIDKDKRVTFCFWNGKTYSTMIYKEP